MNPPWDLVKELVADALERPPSERPGFLDAACAGEPGLRRAVDELLAAAIAADDAIGDGPLADPDHTARTAATDATVSVTQLPAGLRLGVYEVRELLGEGGFSEVYRAEQRAPIQREVALKLLKRGRDTDRLLLRFAVERRTLERLDHPHIARVLDAGATDDGRPFVVMELVRGRPIRDFADAAELSVDARIDLFLQVCDAVEHAHRRGVIHRDLKPSNVLVESVDGASRAKVIDFGIAKLLDETDEGGAPFTLTAEGAFVGTPSYASPEQFGLGAVDVDTRADVYTLGVILYELLTGVRPSDDADGRPRSIQDCMRTVRERVPPRPSQRLRDLRSAGGGDGASTHVDVRALRGDLDWITMRALEIDRERRYPSVAALAEDLRRHVRGDVVLAGPPSVRYRFGRFARRHRVALTAAAVVLIAILGGAVAATIGFVQARDAAERERLAKIDAEAALEESLAVGEFLEDLLTSVEPDDRGQGVTVLELLEGVDQRLAASTALSEFPNVEVRLRTIVGGTYLELGDHENSALHLERAEALARERFGLDDRGRLIALLKLAQTRHRQSRVDESSRLVAEFEERAARAWPDGHGFVREVTYFHARELYERGEFAAAARAFEEIDALEKDVGDSAGRVSALGNLAQSRFAAGDADGALEAAEAAYRIARDDPDAGSERVHAGRSFGLALLGRDVERAITVLRETRDAAAERYGVDHERTLGVATYLAFALQRAGRLEDAQALYEELLPGQERTLGRLHRQVLMSRHNLGMIQSSRDEFAAAVEVLTDALERFEEVRGPEHPETLTCRVHLVDAQARLDGAEVHAEAYERAVAAHDAAYGVDHPQAKDARVDFGRHLIRLARERNERGDAAAARATLERAFTVCGAVGDSRGARQAAEWLVLAARDAGDEEAAARWEQERDAVDGGR